jgi:hypothetical protein
MCYIPEQDQMQDALEKSKMTTYFKLILPNTGNKLKVAIWASGTPEQFLLDVRTTIHMCKQMGLDTNFANAKKAVPTVKLDTKKQRWSMHRFAAPRRRRTRSTYWRVLSPLGCPSLQRPMKLRSSPSLWRKQSYTSCVGTSFLAKPGSNGRNAQVTCTPWEDVYGVNRAKTPTKTWDSFCTCFTFHLHHVFHYDVGETLKYYIMNTLKKPNQVSIHQVFVQVEQHNPTSRCYHACTTVQKLIKLHRRYCHWMMPTS